MSLLELPKPLSALTLPRLKQLASSANLETAWQAIGKVHRADLVEALMERSEEWKAFVASVPPFDTAVQRGRKELKKSKKLESVLEQTIGASVHFIPSGSGVHLGGGLILTCAHCIDHDDDDGGEEDPEPERSEFTGGSSRPPTRTERIKYEAACTAWQSRQAASVAARRVGRCKVSVTAHGIHRSAVCVSADEENDLALMRLEGAVPAALSALPLGAEGSDAPGTPVLAVGNPYDWDLESAQPAPRKMGYHPFWTSCGKIQGELNAQVARDRGVGAQRHSCWTYWGHSGCPIVQSNGGIVALHSSWDDTNGQRHGVPLSAIRAFLQANNGLLRAEELAPSADDAGNTDNTPILIDTDEDEDEEEMLPLAARLALKRKLGA